MYSQTQCVSTKGRNDNDNDCRKFALMLFNRNSHKVDDCCVDSDILLTQFRNRSHIALNWNKNTVFDCFCVRAVKNKSGVQSEVKFVLIYAICSIHPSNTKNEMK